ncbi:hypothetical protein QBC43DRAFT_322964 [Cladorrhinum sp. PSN259]|nr:hypothetical protein QBC43DRAFT_322964 [Cladorrhinum sp. PSN259]
MPTNNLNCSMRLEYRPDPDIAGIGIITGFLGTAWLVAFILLVYYLVFHDPTLDPFSDNLNRNLERPNPIDMVKRTLRLFFMGCLAVMLIVATLATADDDFQDDLPVACFFRFSRSRAGLKDPDVIVSVMLLLYNILLRTLKLHQSVSKKWSLKIKQVFVKFLARPPMRAVATYLTSTDQCSKWKMGLCILVVQPVVAT